MVQSLNIGRLAGAFMSFTLAASGAAANPALSDADRDRELIQQYAGAHRVEIGNDNTTAGLKIVIESKDNPASITPPRLKDEDLNDLVTALVVNVVGDQHPSVYADALSTVWVRTMKQPQQGVGNMEYLDDHGIAALVKSRRPDIADHQEPSRQDIQSAAKAANFVQRQIVTIVAHGPKEQIIPLASSLDESYRTLKTGQPQAPAPSARALNR